MALACCTALSGCASEGLALLQATSALRGNAAAIDRQPLDPAFRYLRATGGGQTVLLALGSVEPGPRGPVEVWYTGGREVVRLEQGRLVGATGLPVEWTGVALPALPGWAQMLEHPAPLHWVRRRDVSPGYRFGLTDSLTLVPVPAGRPGALIGHDPARLRWFEERHADQALPPARYAVDPAAPGGAAVIYGEQCLDATFCITWQRWPPPGRRP